MINLKLHFDQEKKAGKFVSTKNATARVAKGLGIGEATVKRIMAERDLPIKTDEPTRKGRPLPCLPENLYPVIRQFVRSKNLKGQKIRAEEIREHLQKEHAVQISASAFLRTLNRIGFVYGEGKRNSALKEQDHVVSARRKYLRLKRANRNSDGTFKRPEIYLDETYVNKNHSGRFTWYFEEDGPWVNKPSGKGPRLIILHAISWNGWVNHADLIFEAKKRTGDYHGQMNWENFSKWFCSQLLPNIPENSLIILDNASYHNVLAEDAFPTPATRKKELCDWLTKNDYPWTNDLLKPELFDLCQKLAPKPELQLDQIAEAAGHTILRTPQYHPELQPIETCWAVVKNHMADHCDFTLKNFRAQLPIALSKVQPSTCRKLITKVMRQEDQYWEEDALIYENDETMTR